LAALYDELWLCAFRAKEVPSDDELKQVKVYGTTPLLLM
jgi:hypothetical protein